MSFLFLIYFQVVRCYSLIEKMGSLSIAGVNRKMKMNEILKTSDSVKLSLVFEN